MGRERAENSAFDPEHYMADFMDDAAAKAELSSLEGKLMANEYGTFAKLLAMSHERVMEQQQCLTGDATPDVALAYRRKLVATGRIGQRHVQLADLKDARTGFLNDDKLSILARVRVEPQVNWWNWDSKKETGYVGLKNQGATCYMNSLLQTLMHIPYFCKARRRRRTPRRRRPPRPPSLQLAAPRPPPGGVPQGLPPLP